MKHIYCISGFAADERVFAKLQIPDSELYFIKWITPGKNDSIESYAKKLIGQIHHDNPVLIGVSMGGIMCIEISRQIKTKLIIIISSIKSKNEMPLWMRLTGKLKINRLFPIRSFKLIEPIEDYNLGVTKEVKGLIHEYRKNLDIVYSNWAANAIVNWKNRYVPKNLFHIHGDNDRIFPVKNINPDFTIPRGGHMMIMQKYNEVNKCINSILQKHL